MPDPNRRLLAWALTLAPLGALLRSTPSLAQSPIVQPTEKTKAGFLEHARGLRDQAVRDACRRLKMRDLSDCEVYSPPRPASCVRRPSIGRASGVTTMTVPLLRAWLRASRVNPAKAALAAAAPIRPPAG